MKSAVKQFAAFANGLLSIALGTVLLLCPYDSSAGNSLLVLGKVKIDNGNLDDATIVIEKNTEKYRTFKPKKSRFEAELDFGSEYVFIFTKEGYITKKIAISTVIPEDREKQNFEPYEFQVVLYKQVEGVNQLVYNQPVALIKYNEAIDDFDYDTDYTKSIQAALDLVEKEFSREEKEMEKKEKNSTIETVELVTDEDLSKEFKKKEADKAGAEASLNGNAAGVKDNSPDNEKKDVSSAAVAEDVKRSVTPVKETELRPKITKQTGEDGTDYSTAVIAGYEGKARIEHVLEEEVFTPYSALEPAQRERIEQYFKEHHKEITVVVMKDNRREDRYRKVVFKWGGVYYFKNDYNITQAHYELATK